MAIPGPSPKPRDGPARVAQPMGSRKVDPCRGTARCVRSGTEPVPTRNRRLRRNFLMFSSASPSRGISRGLRTASPSRPSTAMATAVDGVALPQIRRFPAARDTTTPRIALVKVLITTCRSNHLGRSDIADAVDEQGEAKLPPVAHQSGAEHEPANGCCSSPSQAGQRRPVNHKRQVG
jgi:hypothetical protein